MGKESRFYHQVHIIKAFVLSRLSKSALTQVIATDVD